MSRIYELKDVPEGEVDSQKRILEQDGAIEVTAKRQENGKYTITAVYPE